MQPAIQPARTTRNPPRAILRKLFMHVPPESPSNLRRGPLDPKSHYSAGRVGHNLQGTRDTGFILPAATQGTDQIDTRAQLQGVEIESFQLRLQ